MGSSYGITVSEGVHDDLYAKALVFDRGDVKGAFVVLDVISLPHTVVMKARELIAQRTGIPASHIIFFSPGKFLQKRVVLNFFTFYSASVGVAHAEQLDDR